MVSRSYLLKKPPGPSGFTRVIHWNVTPAVINGLGAMDERLEDLRLQVRRSTLPTLAFAFAVGAFIANHRWRRSQHR